METIELTVYKKDVYAEVAKATDYTGAKLTGDDNARDRILATDADLSELGRFWDEAVQSVNERLRQMLVSGSTQLKQAEDGSLETAYVSTLEVSKSYDKNLNGSVQSGLRNFFIYFIIGQWFKFANKGEAADYFASAGEEITSAERLLYSRKRPTRPSL